MFKRIALNYLRDWARKDERKPLVLRGARQVGKTTLVKMFAEEFDNYIYLNLEENENAALFAADYSFDDLLSGIFFKAGMTLGSVVAPAILAYVAYNPKTVEQTPEAQEGILWLVCVIPAALLLLAIFIISKYELTDAVIDDINKKIEARHKQGK